MLFNRHPFEHHALRVGAVAGLAGRPPTVRTGESDDITLALSDAISEALEEALRLIRLIAHGARRRGGSRGRGATRRGAEGGQERHYHQQPDRARWLHHAPMKFHS